MNVRDRLAYLVAGHGPRLAVALVVLGAFALGLGISDYTRPATTEVTDRTNPRTFATELRTSAVVTGNTSLYERGTRLEDPPVYLAGATPTLELSLVTRAPANATVHLDREIRLVYVARRGGETFWKNGTVLAADGTSVASGRTTLPADLDVSRVQARLSALREEVGAAGSVAARVEYRVRYRAPTTEGTLEATAPVRFERDAYTLGTAADEETHATPVTRTVAVPAGDRTKALLATAVGALSLVGGVLAGVAYWRRYRDVDPEELALRVHRTRYAEWISTGSAPVDPTANVVGVATLEDLVDVAIDSDARVIHDRDRDAYVVFDDGVVYRFVPDGPDPVARQDAGGSPGDPPGDPRANGATDDGGSDDRTVRPVDDAEPPGDGSAGETGTRPGPVGDASRDGDAPAGARVDGGRSGSGHREDPGPHDPGRPGSGPPGEGIDPLGYDVGELRSLAADPPPGARAVTASEPTEPADDPSSEEGETPDPIDPTRDGGAEAAEPDPRRTDEGSGPADPRDASDDAGNAAGSGGSAGRATGTDRPWFRTAATDRAGPAVVTASSPVHSVPPFRWGAADAPERSDSGSVLASDRFPAEDPDGSTGLAWSDVPDDDGPSGSRPGDGAPWERVPGGGSGRIDE